MPSPELYLKLCSLRRRKAEDDCFNLVGHRHFGAQAYVDYQAGRLQDYDHPTEEIAIALAGLPSIR